MTTLALPQATFLHQIGVAAPCEAEWGAMSPVGGAGRVRRCEDCQLNVYNLSEMTPAEAESLVRAHEGRLCVRYFRRPDGTMLTRDCPRGIERIRRSAARARRRVLAAGAAVASLGAVAINLAEARLDRHRPRDVGPHRVIGEALRSQQPPAPATPTPGAGVWIMGAAVIGSGCAG